jgi:hypothetical protein
MLPKNVGYFLTQSKKLCGFNFNKNDLGYIFGRIFTISSGHPGPDKERRKKKQVWPRVTRLGEFSPNVLLITLDRFLENY